MQRLLTLLFACLAAPAMAFDHVSPAQQCVWSCLYGVGDGNAASDAYHACVNSNCVGLSTDRPGAEPQTGTGAGAAAAPAPVNGPGWTIGSIAGGGGVFANVDAADSPRALSLVCAAGRSYLILDTELDGPGGVMPIIVDGTRFDVSFARNPDWLEADIAPTAPLLAALSQGQGAQLLSTDGNVLGNFSLSGSSRAIATVTEACR
ncbi:hypothetical protein [Jannaschia sp. CCS1]|uniref:hypothetical protein n=1 Tax=Jannaschia sp. (strain CCS1) TaxID=290400 RepID=UPI00006C0044|nr:hypothetical protein [Jannaschia sp. CCS1]ABD55267.1 hypothetical protein Jann_2350 [Jannaschia sp. CCS1]